jgi:hypothetical protein
MSTSFDCQNGLVDEPHFWMPYLLRLNRAVTSRDKSEYDSLLLGQAILV